MLKPLLFFALLATILAPTCVAAIPVAEPFGTTSDGRHVHAFTLENQNGFIAKVITLGATLTQLHVPDREGNARDVVLGFDDVAGYEGPGNQHFGCTTGRVCNRIAKGRFTLDAVEYKLAVNNGRNHLHGGKRRNFGRVVWKATPFFNADGQGVEFSYTSPDGEEGYPGTLSVTVQYFVPDKVNRLEISYTATTDKPTPINLTNHSYFNLSGHGAETVLNHRLKILADRYTPTDQTLIPTGEIASVKGTPLDFRTSTAVGDRITQLDDTPAVGYDHNYVLNDPPDASDWRLAAVLEDPVSGRVMRIQTTEPGVQLYTGNHLKGQPGKRDKSYLRRSALCLETQHHPDSVNHENFPTTILRP